MEKSVKLKKISASAMLCALAFLCMFVFRIKVSFLTFDAKDAVISIISLMFGPLYGVLSAAIVAFLEFLSVSDTGVYGLIMNFLSSGTFALTCGVIYKYKKSFSGAIVGLVISVLSVTSVMLLANLFITPYFMGADRSVVISMIAPLLLPFNLTKAAMNAAITLAIYKPLTTGLKKAGLVPSGNNIHYKLNSKSVLLIVISLIVIVIAIFIFILVLDGKFELIRS